MTVASTPRSALTSNCRWLVTLEVSCDDLNGLTGIEAGWCLLLHHWRVAQQPVNFVDSSNRASEISEDPGLEHGGGRHTLEDCPFLRP